MSYVAIRYFEDMQDDNTAYDVGTIYPRKGVDVSDERIEILSSNRNNLGVPLIVKLKELPAKQEKNDVKENLKDKKEEENISDKLNDMKFEKLKKIADDNNIEYAKNIKKAELIELLIKNNLEIKKE